MLHKIHKILVVDDERAIAATLAKILDYRGYKTAKAYSGEEAVQLACSFQPDCIVSDVMMGKMNGIDAVIEILRYVLCHPVRCCWFPAMLATETFWKTRGRTVSISRFCSSQFLRLNCWRESHRFFPTQPPQPRPDCRRKPASTKGPSALNSIKRSFSLPHPTARRTNRFSFTNVRQIHFALRLHW